MFDHNRITLTVEVNLDPVPGVFHTIESAERIIQNLLDSGIPHYKPVVSIKN